MTLTSVIIVTQLNFGLIYPGVVQPLDQKLLIFGAVLTQYLPSIDLLDTELN